MTRRATTDLPLWRLLKRGHEPALIHHPSGLRHALDTRTPYIPQIRKLIRSNPDGEWWLQVYLDRTAGFVYTPVCPRPRKTRAKKRR